MRASDKIVTLHYNQTVARITVTSVLVVSISFSQGIFLPESTSSADSLTVQSHASTSVLTSKIPTLAAIPLSGHMKILHTLIGMGSTARVAAVPYPGKATKISHKGQRSTNKLFTSVWLCH